MGGPSLPSGERARRQALSPLRPKTIAGLSQDREWPHIAGDQRSRPVRMLAFPWARQRRPTACRIYLLYSGHLARMSNDLCAVTVL